MRTRRLRRRMKTVAKINPVGRMTGKDRDEPSIQLIISTSVALLKDNTRPGGGY